MSAGTRSDNRLPGDDFAAEECQIQAPYRRREDLMNAPLIAVTPLMPSETRHVHILRQLERKLLWLSAWMIHHANHIRPNRDGLKVGGHQASCASCISIVAALYLEVARPQDRIAVKPHAGPVFHAMNYL